MDHDETGCQPPQNGPVLCINNCGFFGSAANMNMCSKCYRDVVLKQEQAKLAATSIENFVNGTSIVAEKEHAVATALNLQGNSVEVQAVTLPSSQGSSSGEAGEPKGPKRCSSCKKKVGLTGFVCRCSNLYCGLHRYSDKHDCQFDYQSAAQDAIAKANPLVKAEKLDKI